MKIACTKLIKNIFPICWLLLLPPFQLVLCAEVGSGISGVGTLTSVPAQVALSSPISGSTNQPLNVTLSWGGVGDATSYQLQVSTGIGFTSIVKDTTLTGTSKQMWDLLERTKYYWRVRGKIGVVNGIWSTTWNFTTDIQPTSIREIFAGLIPKEYQTEQNYPNPFNPSTTIRYGIPFESEVKIEIFDITGQRVTSLVNESQKAGYYEVAFKLDGVSSGMYFYIINAKEIGGSGIFRSVKKMILMK